MGEALSQIGLEFTLTPERLDEGSAEERAAFGLFEIRSEHFSLTEGYDSFIDSYRKGPLVSCYHVAEWLAWNWWRLRWEPRSSTSDWGFAHRLSSIGGGYVWPNVEIWSDGVRTTLLSSASTNPEAKPFRYVGALPLVVPSTMFESAIDAFMTRVLGRLDEAKLSQTNLSRLWNDILAERSDAAVAERRRLEAMLGREPDAVDDDVVEALVADKARLGDAVGEVAAGQTLGRPLLRATDFETLAHVRGFAASPRNAVRLSEKGVIGRRADKPAWLVGSEAARALRVQEKLGASPIEDRRLADLAAVDCRALAMSAGQREAMSFELDKNALESLVFLRAHKVTGRRFELARLIADRILAPAGALHPATDAKTYRQQAQRSFAAEFLSPFEAVQDFLGGDYSEDARQDAADHFQVSEITIRTLLVNHKRLERDELNEGFDAVA
jgi:hypothetical protein